jgi:hypothetical protein
MVDDRGSDRAGISRREVLRRAGVDLKAVKARQQAAWASGYNMTQAAPPANDWRVPRETL